MNGAGEDRSVRSTRWSWSPWASGGAWGTAPTALAATSSRSTCPARRVTRRQRGRGGSTSAVALPGVDRSPGSTGRSVTATRRRRPVQRPRAPGRRAHSRRTDDGLMVRFDVPQRPVAPGQTVALYDTVDHDAVVGVGHRRLSVADRGRSATWLTRRSGGRDPRRPGPKSCASSIAYHNERYHRSTRPRSPTPSSTLLVRELRDHRGRATPTLAVSRFAHPDRGRGPARPCSPPVRHRVPMMSLDNAFAEEELEAWADASGRAGARPRPGRLVFVCEPKIDGLAMSLTYERRAFRAGGHPGRRGDRRGRHRQRGHHQGRAPPARTPRPAPCPSCSRSGARSTCRSADFDDLNRRQAEAGRAAVRQPPELGRRLAPPEGPGDHRQPGALVLGLPGGELVEGGGRTATSPWPAPVAAAGHAGPAWPGRIPGQPRAHAGARDRRGHRPSAGSWRASATISTTRSTAW